MATPITLGKLGLEDIAFGTGILQIDLGNGNFKNITEINLSNIPFDATRTVGEALNEFETLLTSSDYASISTELTKLVTLHNNLAKLVNVEGNLVSILNIQANIVDLTLLASNIPLLVQIPTDLAYIQTIKRDILYIECNMRKLMKELRNSEKFVYDLYVNKLDPLDTKMDLMEARLDTLLANAVADITAGNELAQKFGTYTLVIQPKPNCANPNFIIDDVHQRLIWQIPTVKGDCAVLQSQVETQIVQATTDAYLATLALGGGGVTTADVNALISAYHLANPIVDTEYRIIEEALNWKVVSSEGGAVPNYDKITYPLATDAFMQYMITEQGFVAGTDATQFRATAFETLKVNYIFGLADGSLIEYTLYTHTDSTNDAILSEKLVENIVGTEIIDSNTIALVNTGRGILVKAPNTAVITAHSSEYTVTVDNLSFFTGMGLISVTLAVDPTGMSSADDGEHYITLNVDGIEVYVGVDIFYDPATSTVTISGQNRLRYDLTRATTWRSSPTMGAKPTVEVGASNIPDTVEIIEGTGLSFDAITLNGTAGGGTLPNYNVTFNIEAGFVVDSLFKVRIGDDTNGYITVLMRPTAVGPFYLTEGIDYITTKGEVQ